VNRRWHRFVVPWGALLLVLSFQSADSRAEDRRALRATSGGGGLRERPAAAVERSSTRRTREAPIRRSTVEGAILQHRREHPAKETRLPAQLRVVQTLYETRGAETARRAAERMGVRLVYGQALVLVHPEAGAGPHLLERFGALGYVVMPPGPGVEHAFQVLIPLGELRRAAETEGVRALSGPPVLAQHVVSEGVARTQADAWLGFDPPPGLPLGRPAKIAVVDLGFAGYEELLGQELPASVATAAFCGSFPANMAGCDPAEPEVHGTGVAEIVHDMAPDAQLLLAVFSGTFGTFQQALEYARTWGADVINSSVGTVFDNRDGGGALCSLANSLSASGIAWVISSGNEGYVCGHEHYSIQLSDFSPGGGYGAFQSFPAKTDPILNEFQLRAGFVHILELTWNGWSSAPTDDFDLFYFCDRGTGWELVAVSDDLQCGEAGTVPYEAIAILNDTGQGLNCAYAVAQWAPGACPSPSGRRFDTWSMAVDEAFTTLACPGLEHQTSQYTVAHPADCAGGLAAGAVCVHDNGLEYYSSQGPTLDGRTKPDFCAPAAVSNFTYGPSSACSGTGGTAGFAGTSASAPHLAGALALMYEKIGGAYTMAEVRTILERRTGAGGAMTNTCGHGRLCLSATGCN
jgi:subtilisin family serine protease